MLVVGLTGSIGMGKSTTLRMFAEQGAAIYDADAAVHALYRGRAAPLIEAAFPGTVKDNEVDRAELARRVLDNPAALKQLESIIHPLVRQERERFLERARASGVAIAVLDIPLLFETHSEKLFDAVVVVSAPEAEQRARVLARPDMDENKLSSILARQMPDAEKRRRAHFIVDTSLGLDSARAQVRAILQALRAGATEHARDRSRHRDDGT